MRRKTQSGNVVSSHSSECGASSLVAKLRIDSRSASCSSVKMKWRLEAAWSGLRTSVAAIKWTVGLPTSSRKHAVLKSISRVRSLYEPGGGGPPWGGREMMRRLKFSLSLVAVIGLIAVVVGGVAGRASAGSSGGSSGGGSG